ncbi:MAG TPA: hypothetical protein VD995_12410 [Azospirillum sp.]|nr:hypothetical protein [Azospirillum sp.]
MPELSRGILEDAIHMVHSSERLQADAKARLIGKLRVLQAGVCEGHGHSRGDCAACPVGCACRILVKRLFAGDPPH